MQGCDPIVVFVAFGGGEFAFDAAQFGIAAEHIVDRGLGGSRYFLREMRDAALARQFELAAVGLEFAEDHLEQARLAGTVRADQAHLLIRV